MPQRSRRRFIRKVAGSSFLAAAWPGILEARPEKEYLIATDTKRQWQNSPIRLGAIGMGIMGYNNVRTALQVPGVTLVAACDLYAGRLESSKEQFGANLFTTRDYREVLDRDDVDGVIVSTSDHWHDKISIEAMKRGKAVYCEKPMVHQIAEGKALIDAEQDTGQVFQVGSQRVSSIIYEKAGELYRQGAIGQLVLAETYNDRYSRIGAWQYSIPTDASEKTVDWKAFIGDAPKRSYDPNRFFRWRNYQDYGTGVAGDLFVHLFSGLHVTLGSSGPSKIYASGGLRFWEDGRDVPDVMLAVVDYPEAANHPAFNLQIRVNFVASGGGGSLLKLVGTEGTMIINSREIKVSKNKIPDAPGFGGWDSYGTFTKAQQGAYEAWYKATYPRQYELEQPGEIIYRTPQGYSDHLDHWTNFFESIRTGKPVVEDATFGLRAAAPSLATNVSLFEKRVVNWDPDNLKLV